MDGIVMVRVRGCGLPLLTIGFDDVCWKVRMRMMMQLRSSLVHCPNLGGSGGRRWHRE